MKGGNKSGLKMRDDYFEHRQLALIWSTSQQKGGYHRSYLNFFFHFSLEMRDKIGFVLILRMEMRED